MLAALIVGEQDPEHLADLACGTARRKRPELLEALRRRVTTHHRALLQLHLDTISTLETAVAQVEAAMGTTLVPIAAAADLLKTMPGVSDVVAHVLLAEIGVDMSRFPTAGHLVSWAAVCHKDSYLHTQFLRIKTRRGA